MRVTKLYTESAKPVISMEFFPPRDEKAIATFDKVIDTLKTVSPDCVTMTFGAGGSTRDGSYQAVKRLIEKQNLPVVAYIAGYGLGPDEITAVLDNYKALGVQTIFAVRGDMPQDADFKPHPDAFQYASEMIAFIREHYDFTLGCAGYPEGHIDATSLDDDIAYLKRKVDNGAEYVVSQYFYDNDFFFDYVDKCRAAGVTVPIIPGIMPVYTVKMTRNLAKICGSSITKPLAVELERLATADKEEVIDFGIDFATEQCRDLLKNGVTGLHFYTMNRSKTTVEIINRLREEKLL
jgi:methylenetetrahydrofolate reductase (NADPH)